MSPLPAERDLPAGRHAGMRDRLLAKTSTIGSADGTERRPRRLALVAAAATAAGMLGVAVIVSVTMNNVGPSDTVDPAAPPRQATSTTTFVRPVVEGLTPAQSDEITRGCAQSFGGSGYGQDGMPEPSGPTGTGMPEAGPNIALYNLIEDEAGKLALIYGEGVSLLCTIDGPAMKYNAGGGGARPHELTGAFDVDDESGSSGGDLSDDKYPGYRGLPGYRVAAGRVSADVTRVTVTADGRTVEAVLRNGTFIGRLIYPSSWEASATDRITVHAYDADGRELPADGPTSRWP
jgi:hypothetical protein